MIVAQDEELIVYTGLAFSVAYDFRNDDNSSIDLSDKSATAILINTHDETKEEDKTFENYGTITIHPENEVGRLLLELSAEETAKIFIPESEDTPYTISDIYAKIIVVDENELPLLDINVRPVKVK